MAEVVVFAGNESVHVAPVNDFVPAVPPVRVQLYVAVPVHDAVHVTDPPALDTLAAVVGETLQFVGTVGAGVLAAAQLTVACA